MNMAAASIPVIVQQHAEEVAALRHIRSVLLRSPHAELPRLRRLDDRLAAHFDGLHVAGPEAWPCLLEALAAPSPGAVFAAAVLALQTRDAGRLAHLVALAASLPEAERGLLSALGWVSAEDLQGTVRALFGSAVPVHRGWGLAACAMHRVDSGAMLGQFIQDADAGLRVRAWRAAGQSGRRDLADAARAALRDNTKPAAPDPSGWTAHRAAAWALTLWGLGQDEQVRAALTDTPGAAGDPKQPFPPQDAHRLVLMAAPVEWGREQVRALAPLAEQQPRARRRMMRMAAWIGDVQVVPWLIYFMADDAWARLAGECFSLITGADLAAEGLERPQGEEPEGLGGPSDDPDDALVAMDEDDSLPWPDQAKVQAWWQARADRFKAGQRYFVGLPPDEAHLLDILKTAGQRQRIMASEHLCLRQPGSGLFPVAAPSWRQSRWLDTLTAKA